MHICIKHKAYNIVYICIKMYDIVHVYLIYNVNLTWIVQCKLRIFFVIISQSTMILLYVLFIMFA